MSFEKLIWDVPHFSLSDMTKTENRAFVEENKKITQDQADKLSLICTGLLLPIWERWGAIVILSAYRCPKLNSAVGSSDKSQHLLCEAVDFEVLGRSRGKPLYEVFDWIRKESRIHFGQLIFELGEWIHISLGEPYRPKNKCMQVLEYKKDDKGKGYYEMLSQAKLV